MVVTSENIVVTFDGLQDLMITVPETYNQDNTPGHRFAGLCGNLDHNPDNDMVDYKGELQSTAKQFARYVIFNIVRFIWFSYSLQFFSFST